MANSITDIGGGQGQPWALRATGRSHRPDADGMARTRALLEQGRLPAPADDDRALARMLGAMLLTGLAMTGGAIYGLVQILT